jgi:hypothetical protein
LKNQKIKKKNHAGKRRKNSQYFKGKKLLSEIFNMLNIKKVKSTKIILKKKKRKVGKKKEENNFGKKGGNLEKKKDEKKKEEEMHHGLLF